MLCALYHILSKTQKSWLRVWTEQWLFSVTVCHSRPRTSPDPFLERERVGINKYLFWSMHLILLFFICTFLLGYNAHSVNRAPRASLRARPGTMGNISGAQHILRPLPTQSLALSEFHRIIGFAHSVPHKNGAKSTNPFGVANGNSL